MWARVPKFPLMTSTLQRAELQNKIWKIASDSGTALNALLPKMSPLNPEYLSRKQRVFQKLSQFVEKFKGVGGAV